MKTPAPSSVTAIGFLGALLHFSCFLFGFTHTQQSAITKCSRKHNSKNLLFHLRGKMNSFSA